MSDGTGIQWTDATWNPIRGCSRVSAGCMNCYAEKVAARFSGPGLPYEGLVKRTSHGPAWTGTVDLVRDALYLPIRWRKPRRIFVNSMSDLFHEGVEDEWIDKVFAVMGACQHHTFQVLTKRPQRMLEWFSERWQPVPEATQRDHYNRLSLVASRFGKSLPPFRLDTEGETRYHQVESEFDWMEIPTTDLFFTPDGRSRFMASSWPFPNVWLGVSVEDQATADERIPLLLRTPAAKRFVSYEPALEAVNVARYLSKQCDNGSVPGPHPGSGVMCPICDGLNLGNCDGIDWIIVGGESGPGARPFDIRWARDVIAQCKTAGTAVFMKQAGSFVIDRNDAGFEGDGDDLWPEGTADELIWEPFGYVDQAQGASVRIKLRDRAGADPNEWPEDLRVREFP